MRKAYSLAIIILAAIFLLGGCFHGEEGENKEIDPSPEVLNQIPESVGRVEFSEDQNIIEITSNGFVPRTIEIMASESVIWINRDTKRHWPASNVHPTHEGYPGSSIRKCESVDQNKIFDACRGISESETYEFVFDRRGTWEYHDHMSPSKKGVVVVK